MTSAELLADAFGRIQEVVHEVVEGLTPEQLSARLDAETNSIAWLVWHLTRVQDDHVAAAAGDEQVWLAQDWVGRFGLPFEPLETGYGQGPEDVGALHTSAALLAGYYDAVHDQTVRWVRGLDDMDLDRVVDENWDPPVTLGVRLVSVIADDLQHAGQAGFVRGAITRRR